MLRETIDPVVGPRSFQGRRLATGMGLPPASMANSLAQQMVRMYGAFKAKDYSMVEVNPLVMTQDGRLVALDAKVTLDDDALFRQQDMAALRDWGQDTPLEAEAGQAGIAYVKLDGDVGCLVNGAGLAMATMDTINAGGQRPANFLDVGGGADPDRVATAMGIILDDPQVTRILVNVFGGIARCDDIARGIVQAIPEAQKGGIPLVVRLLGTNLEEGKRILTEAGLNIRFVDSMREATEVLSTH